MKIPRLPVLPRFPELERFLRDFTASVNSEFSARTRDDTVRRSLLLKATDDTSIWEVTVDSLGNVSATKVSDG